MPTVRRIEKIKRVLAQRQPDLRVVLEEVTNTHNASAVVRTCDSAGVLYIHIISADSKPYPVNEAISTRAEKWIEFDYYKTTAKCLQALKSKGFKIAATSLREKAIPHTQINYCQPISLVFGNESQGISEEACTLSDFLIKIPMFGMVQSLNLSVSVGIILYEALKQRKERGYRNTDWSSSPEFHRIMNKWLKS